MIQDVSCCEGCFFTGVIDGYQPECNCKSKEAIQQIMKKTAEEAGIEGASKTHESSTQKEDSSFFIPVKDRTTSIRRRRNKAKADKRTVQILPFVGSKLDKLSDNASQAEHSRAIKKIDNVAGITKPRYQMSLLLSFPEIPEKHYGSSLSRLIERLESWKRDADFGEKKNIELSLSCEKAISILNIVRLYEGEICSLHREKNELHDELHVNIGFLDKTSLSTFKRNLSKM